MVYDELDIGPFDLSPQDRQSLKYDVVETLPAEKHRTVKLKKVEIVDLLMQTDLGKGLGKQALLNMRLADLQDKAAALSIDIMATVTSKLRKGWVGKGKGLLQVLWERGFIDESKVKNYKVKVLDEDGNVVPTFSLEYMMANCPDFVNEMSQLEYVCQQLGTKTIITTKYHAEFAGEGIEYSWGYSKSLYRRSPLKMKRGKEQFDKLVSYCISRETMTRELVRRFSKRARQYMLSYQALDLQAQRNHSGTTNDCNQSISYQQIEKMKAMLKSHRAAIDFDNKFIMKAVMDFSISTSAPKRVLIDGATKSKKKKNN